MKFKDKEVVWVKLGKSWWPGEICGDARLPAGLLDSFRNRPIAVVKFFQENKFEYVNNCRNIHKYNCAMKNDFIKKGIDLFRANHAYMEKFPADVAKAEILTGGDPEILNKIAYSSNERSDYSSVFGESSKKSRKRKRGKKKSKSKSPTRDTPTNMNKHNRNTSTPSTSNNTFPQLKSYKCHICPYSSDRVNVIILHIKSHKFDKPPSTVNSTAIVTSTTTTPTISKYSSCGSKPLIAVSSDSISLSSSPSTSVLSSPSTSVVSSPSELSPLSTVSTPTRSTSHGRKHKLKKLMFDSEEDIETPVRCSTPYPAKNLKRIAPNIAQESKEKNEDKKENIILPPKIPKTKAEIKIAILADWSEDDEEENVQNVITPNIVNKMSDAPMAVPSQEPPIRLENEIDQLIKTADSTTNTGDEDKPQSDVVNSSDKCISVPKYRNIPKKDRRDVVLKEFSNGDILTARNNASSTRGDEKIQNDNFQSVHITDKGDALSIEKTTKLTESETPASIVSIETRKSKENEMASTSEQKTKGIPKQSISCFDFQEEEEDEDFLTSLSKLKKKYMKPDNKDYGNEARATAANDNDEHNIRLRDKQLSADIENLLDSTRPREVKIDSSQIKISSPTISDTVSKEVRALPPKERGKRIFKSRNKSKLDEVNIEAEKKNDPLPESQSEVVEIPVQSSVVDDTVFTIEVVGVKRSDEIENIVSSATKETTASDEDISTSIEEERSNSGYNSEELNFKSPEMKVNNSETTEEVVDNENIIEVDSTTSSEKPDSEIHPTSDESFVIGTEITNDVNYIEKQEDVSTRNEAAIQSSKVYEGKPDKTINIEDIAQKENELDIAETLISIPKKITELGNKSRNLIPGPSGSMYIPIIDLSTSEDKESIVEESSKIVMQEKQTTEISTSGSIHTEDVEEQENEDDVIFSVTTNQSHCKHEIHDIQSYEDIPFIKEKGIDIQKNASGAGDQESRSKNKIQHTKQKSISMEPDVDKNTVTSATELIPRPRKEINTVHSSYDNKDINVRKRRTHVKITPRKRVFLFPTKIEQSSSQSQSLRIKKIDNDDKQCPSVSGILKTDNEVDAENCVVTSENKSKDCGMKLSNEVIIFDEYVQPKTMTTTCKEGEQKNSTEEILSEAVSSSTEIGENFNIKSSKKSKQNLHDRIPDSQLGMVQTKSNTLQINLRVEELSKEISSGSEDNGHIEFDSDSEKSIEIATIKRGETAGNKSDIEISNSSEQMEVEILNTEDCIEQENVIEKNQSLTKNDNIDDQQIDKEDNNVRLAVVENVEVIQIEEVLVKDVDECVTGDMNAAAARNEFETAPSENVTTENDIVTTETEVVVAEGDVTPDTEIVATENIIMTTENEIMTTETEIVTIESEIVTTESEIVTTESEVVATESQTMVTDSSSIENEEVNIKDSSQINVSLVHNEAASNNCETSSQSSIQSSSKNINIISNEIVTCTIAENVSKECKEISIHTAKNDRKSVENAISKISSNSIFETRIPKKRKQNVEDGIPSFVLEKNSTSNREFVSAEKIPRVEKSCVLQKDIQHCSTKVASSSSSNSNSNDESVFDINNIPILLANDSVTTENLDEINVSIAENTQSSIVSETVSSGKKSGVKVKLIKPQVNVNISNVTTSSTTSTSEQNSSMVRPDEEKQIGVDGKGNKFVLIKSGNSAKMIIQPDIPKMFLSQQRQLSPDSTEQVKGKIMLSDKMIKVSSIKTTASSTAMVAVNSSITGTPKSETVHEETKTEQNIIYPSGPIIKAGVGSQLVITSKGTIIAQAILPTVSSSLVASTSAYHKSKSNKQIICQASGSVIKPQNQKIQKIENQSTVEETVSNNKIFIQKNNNNSNNNNNTNGNISVDNTNNDKANNNNNNKNYDTTNNELPSTSAGVRRDVIKMTHRKLAEMTRLGFIEEKPDGKVLTASGFRQMQQQKLISQKIVRKTKTKTDDSSNITNVVSTEIPPLAPISDGQAQVKSPKKKIPSHSKDKPTVASLVSVAQKQIEKTTKDHNNDLSSKYGDGNLLAVPGETFGGPPDSFFLCTMADDEVGFIPIDNQPLYLDGSNQLVPMLPADATETVNSEKPTSPSSQQESQIAQIHTSPEKNEKILTNLLQISQGANPTFVIDTADGHQILLDQRCLLALIASGNDGPRLVLPDGQHVILPPEILTTIGINQSSEIGGQILLSETTSNQDIIAAALAGTEVYQQEQLIGDVLQIETSNNVQIVDQGITFQPINQPVTAETNETNAILTQPPIMSTLEVPSSNKKAQIEHMAVSTSNETGLIGQNLDDSLAVIGVNTQTSNVPSSLELPITVTNPAIAPKTSANPITLGGIYTTTVLSQASQISPTLSTIGNSENELNYDPFTTSNITSRNSSEIVSNSDFSTTKKNIKITIPGGNNIIGNSTSGVTILRSSPSLLVSSASSSVPVSSRVTAAVATTTAIPTTLSSLSSSSCSSSSSASPLSSLSSSSSALLSSPPLPSSSSPSPSPSSTTIIPEVGSVTTTRTVTSINEVDSTNQISEIDVQSQSDSTTYEDPAR